MREPLSRAACAVAAVLAVLSTGVAGSSSVTAAEPPTVEVVPPGLADVAYDVWYDRWGQSLADVPVGADPSQTRHLTGALESPVDAGDQYAMRMRALLTPLVSGSYRFAVSGDDDARLFLNPGGDDPSGARRIAYVAGWTTFRQFDRFASQRSDWFDLTAGRQYYIEVIGKEGSFGDHFSVAWEQRDGFEPTLVPGEVLEATALGSGGWRTSTPSGLPSAPSPMIEPGWESVAGDESLVVSWHPVDGAEWYEVRLEGSGEVRDAIVAEPSVQFDDLVPDTRYLVEVAPANPAARMPVASTVRVTLPGSYPTPLQPTAGDRPTVSYDRWDTGWWTLTSVPFGAAPASSGTLSSGFETPPNQGDHHAARIRAVLTPAVTGDYVFFLSADDDARLFLDPGGVAAKDARQIAHVAGWTQQYQWNRYQSQRSGSHRLEAGRSYYLEAIAVHALGLDHLEVGWSRDGGAIVVIPGDVLTPTMAGGGGWRTDPTTLPPPPGSPEIDADAGLDDVEVAWSAPTVDADHGAVAHYEVVLAGDGVTERVLVTDTSVTFDRLRPDTDYEVTVTAWNDGGPSRAVAAGVRTSGRGSGDVTGGDAAPTRGRYAVLATGTTPACRGLELSGSTARIAGDVHTNGSVGLHVGTLSMHGTLSYGVAVESGSHLVGTAVHETVPLPPTCRSTSSHCSPARSRRASTSTATSGTRRSVRLRPRESISSTGTSPSRGAGSISTA